jgi:8-oxo-dGTP pyrophosphatase MutT (NUDIX family)
MDIRHTRADFGVFSKDYYVVHFGPRVGVVVVRDGKILMVRQYRFLVNDLSWEIPGGKVDDGETPEMAAVRECYEETGATCHNLRKLVVYYPGLDNVQNRTTVLCTENVDLPSAFNSNETEVEEIAWVAVDECMKMIADERILDALTVTGILAYVAAGRHTGPD